MKPCLIHPNKPHYFGYVNVTIGGKSYMAHRVAYEEAHGPIPAGMVVRHKCDVRNCVEPTHLELGDHQDNMDDMTSRGRQVKGARVHTAKLIPEQVLAIRAAYATGEATKAQLARIYKVTQENIHAIIIRKSWKDI